MKTIVTTALLALIAITPTTFAAEFTQGRQLTSADDFAVLAPRDRVATENRKIGRAHV